MIINKNNKHILNRYGEEGCGDIPGGQELVFRVTLLENPKKK